MAAYYNEKDPFAAQWLRNLIAAGVIAPGDVDERDIQDVVPVELYRYAQVHLFAGIGVWSYVMRRAGWPDDRPGWSCSCPCQPFSQAGQGAGFADERHLWPAAYHLIGQCGPDVVIGEQVASKDGVAWLDLVQDDMEAANYTFGACVTPAAGYGAPHIRHRTYWMAYYYGAGLAQQRRDGRISYGQVGAFPWQSIERNCTPVGGVADNTEPGRFPWRRSTLEGDGGEKTREQFGRLRDASGLANSIGRQLPQGGRGPFGRTWEPGTTKEPDRPGPVSGVWSAADWLRCQDDRWRPVEPSTFPLAYGVANRVGLLRGYGNAVVAPQAEEWARLALEFAP